MSELKVLSKLKMAGKLRFWRGTIEIPEDELHAICDEIQAEHDRTISALNKAAGNWAKADAELRELVRCKDCEWRVEKDTGAPLRCGHTHGGSPYLFPVEKDSYCSWGERKVVEQ